MKRMAMWVGVVALAGCASVGVTRMKSVSAKPESCQVDIYTTEAEVRRPFDVVCLLDSKTGSTLFHDKTVAGAIEQSKPEACKCGGDAIIVGNTTVKGVDFNSWGEGTATMRVIRYLTSHPPALPPHAAR